MFLNNIKPSHWSKSNELRIDVIDSLKKIIQRILNIKDLFYESIRGEKKYWFLHCFPHHTGIDYLCELSKKYDLFRAYVINHQNLKKSKWLVSKKFIVSISKYKSLWLKAYMQTAVPHNGHTASNKLINNAMHFVIYEIHYVKDTCHLRR